MSSIIVFNYREFQAKVDIKNLGSDVALQIVQAQKAALSGNLPAQIPTVSPWKPAYGAYFDIASDNKSFIYFADLNNSNFFDDSDCTGECINKMSITEGYYISNIESYVGSSSTASIDSPFSITFKRPDSRAIFSYSNGTPLTGFDYIQITIASPQSTITAQIKIYPSGRIQVS
jgi:hypothetical protein